VHLNDSKFSFLDSCYVCGDGVWEKLRLVKGELIELERRLNRIYEGASSIQLSIGFSREEVKDILFNISFLNKMTDGT